jgi:tocopherol O-methyltransferase
MHFGYYDEPSQSHPNAILRMNQVMADAAGIGPEDRVLDAGCGFGGSAIWLAREVGCRVLGLNCIHSQLVRARHAAHASAVDDKVTFARGDYSSIPFPDASFDVVWGLESIVHAPDKGRFLREAGRVLKPGGRVVIGEYMLRGSPPLSSREHAELRPWLDGWAMPSLLTPAEYGELAVQAGLVRASARDVTPNVLPSMKRLERLVEVNAWIARAGLVARMVRQLWGAADARRAHVEGCEVQLATLEKGYWNYMIFSAFKP